MKFQFNKTELQRIEKNLKMRYAALPTLKNKESALRALIKKHKEQLKVLKKEFEQENQKILSLQSLFTEFVDLVKVDKINISIHKMAGVKTPVFESVDFIVEKFSLFNNPSWFLEGIELIKKITSFKIQIKVEEERIRILEYARKKTTQKVNLYEKVQIPAFEEAIIKIKRFLADEENLDRASQKIVKKRQVAVI